MVSGVALNFLMFKGFVKCGDLEGSCSKTKKDGREGEREGGGGRKREKTASWFQEVMLVYYSSFWFL